MATYAGVYSEHLQDRYGNGYRNALVAVQTLAAAPVTLYADRVKTAYVPASGLAANEIKADTKGNLRFFADPGNYQIVVTPSGGSTLAAFPVSVLPDPLEPDASEGALAAEQAARVAADDALSTSVAGKVSKSANGSDFADVAAVRDNLGLGDAATQDAADLPVSDAQGAALAAKISSKGPMATGKVAQSVGQSQVIAASQQGSGYSVILADGMYNGPAAPGIRQLADGTYLMVYRRAVNHAPSKGDIYGRILTLSEDLQWTVGAAFLVCTDATYDVRDAQLTMLSDGRLAMTYFLEDPVTADTLPGNGCRVRFLPAGASPVQANWGSPIVLTDGFNYRSACSAPLVEAPNGRLYMPVYGRNDTEAYDSAVVLTSTDGGLTWGSPVKVANGVTHSRQYGETTMTWVEGRGQFLVKVRSAAEHKIYRLYSANGGGPNYTSPVFAHDGNSSPRTIQLASGRVLTIVRGPTATLGTRTCLVASDDESITSGDLVVLDSLTAACDYGDFIEPVPGMVGVFYNIPSSASVSDIRFRWVADRAGFTPSGHALTRGVTVVEGDLEVYAPSVMALLEPDGRKPLAILESDLGSPPKGVLRFYEPFTAALLASVDAAGWAALLAHAAATNNPHAVTKAQVGLSNADNTSDLSKPVSVDQQAAIDAKTDRIQVIEGQYLLNVLGNSTGVTVQSELWLAPMWLDYDTPIDRIAVEVTAGVAASTIRPTIYGADANGRPSTPIVDGGALDASTATIKEATVSATIPRGWSWWGAVAQGGAPTMRRASVFTAARPLAVDFSAAFNAPLPSQAGVVGALPSPFVRSGGYGTPICVRVRVAA